MDWIKLYASKVLRGTMASEPLEFQAIWFRLMCLANEVDYRDGTLRFPPNIPMTRAYIATYTQIPLDLLNEAIEYYKQEVNEDPNSPHYRVARMQELDGGILFLTNFKECQAVPEEKKKHIEDARERELRERRNMRLYNDRYPDEAAKIRKEQDQREKLYRQAKKQATS